MKVCEVTLPSNRFSAAEGLIVLILHIDFKEIELVVCTPLNGD